jgi:tripartite ATP-independent transporter DctP family solute receptor
MIMLIAVWTLPTATTAQVNKVVLKLGTANAPGHPSILALRGVAEVLNKRTNGRIELQIFPGAQLGGILEILDQTSKGTIQMAQMNPTITAQLVPAMGVFAAPYLFPDLESAYRAEASQVGQMIVAELRKTRKLRALRPWFLGSWNFVTTAKPVHTCEDLRGMKLRVPPGPVLKEFLEQCGAAVIAMNASEVYLALQTRLIDGIPIPLAAIEANKYNEVAKHATLTYHLFDLFHTFVNEDTWQRLSPEDQKILVDAFAAGSKVNDKLILEAEAAMLEDFKRRGIQVDAKPDVESFKRAALRTWAKFEGEWGGKDVVRKLQEAAMGR